MFYKIFFFLNLPKSIARRMFFLNSVKKETFEKVKMIEKKDLAKIRVIFQFHVKIRLTFPQQFECPKSSE